MRRRCRLPVVVGRRDAHHIPRLGARRRRPHGRWRRSKPGRALLPPWGQDHREARRHDLERRGARRRQRRRGQAGQRLELLLGTPDAARHDGRRVAAGDGALEDHPLLHLLGRIAQRLGRDRVDVVLDNKLLELFLRQRGTGGSPVERHAPDAAHQHCRRVGPCARPFVKDFLLLIGAHLPEGLLRTGVDAVVLHKLPQRVVQQRPRDLVHILALHDRRQELAQNLHLVLALCSPLSLLILLIDGFLAFRGGILPSRRLTLRILLALNLCPLSRLPGLRRLVRLPAGLRLLGLLPFASTRLPRLLLALGLLQVLRAQRLDARVEQSCREVQLLPVVGHNWLLVQGLGRLLRGLLGLVPQHDRAR
mmetsp:Transcript_86811/g.268788  ORF Transcript_86811/g.268788 Transcript_86811/m.268788 type:complete len:364 (-) Transcript_86811:280-1371(-)